MCEKYFEMCEKYCVAEMCGNYVSEMCEIYERIVCNKMCEIYVNETYNKM